MPKTTNPFEPIFYTYIYLNPLKPGQYTYEDFISFPFEPFYVGKGYGKRIHDHFKHIKKLKEIQNINAINIFVTLY